MSMKRKRSAGSLVTPSALEASSTTPFFSSPVRLPNFFVQSKTHDPQSSPLSWKHANQETTEQEDGAQQTLNSRTRKRYRDGRPQEAQIHATTVEKLFEAQKAHPHASPLPSQQPHTQHQSLPQFANHDAPQRSTLHSFWHLPQPSQTQQHGMPVQISQQEGLTCDGCDRVLVPEYGMDTLDAETACRACGKHVCDTCAITAEVRLCLDCAMQG